MTEAPLVTDVFQALWDAPLSSRGFLSFNYDGKSLRRHGLDHKTITLLGITNVPGLGVTLTCHEKGGTHWTGRGMKRNYDSAQAYTLLVARKPEDKPGIFRYIVVGGYVSYNTSAAERECHTQIIGGQLS